MKLVLTLLALIMVISNNSVAQETKAFPSMSSRYLGQNPPGKTPELFAPGVISREDHFEHSSAVFAADMREIYWTSKPNSERYYRVYFIELQGEVWTEPKVVPFLEINYREAAPVLDPEGHKLYFSSGSSISVVERQDGNWSDPVPAIKVTDANVERGILGAANRGVIYYWEYEISTEKRGIYVSRMSGTDRLKPEKLDEGFVSAFDQIGSLFVAPDESYMLLELLWDGRNEIFVSYKTKDNLWSEVLNLPFGFGRFPLVSPDGKYIFFMKHAGIFWVSAGIIKELRPIEIE